MKRHCASGQTCQRRQWLQQAALLAGAMAVPRQMCGEAPPRRPAQIAITLDLEMSRNFPTWEDTHWDYEKGNLNEAAKQYSLTAGKLVESYGGHIHYFLVGSALEQADVQWLKELIKAGHPLGNHTYDHVNLLAQAAEEIQFKFKRAPWLIAGRPTAEVLRENIRLTSQAMQSRLGIENQGFRTPGGFQRGLHDRADLQQLLIDTGFTWVSSLYPTHQYGTPQTKPDAQVLQSILDAQQHSQPFRYPSGLIEIPMSPISDIGAFRTGRWQLAWFLEVIERTVRSVIAQGGTFDFLAHPSCLGVIDPNCQTIELICQLVREAGDQAQLVDLNQIAANLA